MHHICEHLIVAQFKEIVRQTSTLNYCYIIIQISLWGIIEKTKLKTHVGSCQIMSEHVNLVFCLSFSACHPVGVICAAPAVEGAWWRAQVITFYKDTNEVEIRYVDYGGYDRVKIHSLRQIR